MKTKTYRTRNHRTNVKHTKKKIEPETRLSLDLYGPLRYVMNNLDVRYALMSPPDFSLGNNAH